MKKHLLLLVFILSSYNLSAQNLIVNGDFESGANGVGFITDGAGYSELLAPFSGSTVSGNFALATNPVAVNSSIFINGGDHTSGSGKMLIIDGNTTAGSPRFWKAGNAGSGICGLTIGTSYTFSYWVKSISATVTNAATQPGIGISFTGISNIVPAPFSSVVPLPASGWKQVVYTFKATATCVTIELWNNNVGALGNDFAVDDFSLTGPQPLSLSYTSQSPTCPGLSNGSISGFGTGGVLPYANYTLTGISPIIAPISNTTGIFTGLNAGTYSLSVRDAVNTVITQNNIVLTAPADLTVSSGVTNCSTTPTILSASGGSSGYSWTAFPSDSTLTTPNVSNPTVSPTQTTVYTVTSSSVITNDELIYNGDFSLGNVGFSTDYKYLVVSPGAQGRYGITTNANSYWSGFQPCVERLSPGVGKMMVADGSIVNAGNDRVWCQTVPVKPGQNYVFSYWSESIQSATLANIEVLINGVSIAPPASTGGVCNWVKRTINWNSGANITAEICMYDRSIISAGNDFAIDDISFKALGENICNLSKSITIVVGVPIVPNFPTNLTICPGNSIPILETLSPNGVSGTWNPATINGIKSGKYFFTPDSNLFPCASSITLDVEVFSNCSFGTHATAILLENCTTQEGGEFFNTTGSGSDLIGPSANVFTNDLGIYIQNSGTLKFRGGELKSFKSASANICGARINYRVYKESTVPGAFNAIELSLYDNCNSNSGQFQSGGTCKAGDQKWRKVLLDSDSPLDLTNLSPGNYILEVYYDVDGDEDSSNGCDNLIFLNNNGNNYLSKFKVQQKPGFIVSNISSCSKNDGKIIILDLIPNTSYDISYKSGNVLIGPKSLISTESGSIELLDLIEGTYSDFLVKFNNCSFLYDNTILIFNPALTPTFIPIESICSGSTQNGLPTISNDGITGTWSPVFNNTKTTEYTFTPDSGQCATSVKITVEVNSSLTPIFNPIVSICSGDFLPSLPTTSINGISGVWSPALNNLVTTTYTFIPTSGQCAINVSTEIVVNSKETPIFSPVNPICSGDILSPLPTNSLNGITGTWSPTLNNTATTLYTFTPSSNQCSTTANLTINVTSISIPTFTVVNSYCKGSLIPDLPTTSNNGIIGTWSPNINNTTTTTYTFIPNVGQCASATTLTLNINSIETPSFIPINPICAGAILEPLSTTSTNGISGAWSPALNNTSTTEYSFTPNLGQCGTPVKLTITVIPNTTPIFEPISPICSGDFLSPLPNTSINGIIGFWSPTIDNTITKTYNFTPSSGQCATSQTVTVLVNSIPEFSVSGVCDGTDFVLSSNQENNLDNLTYSWYNSLNEKIGSSPAVVIKQKGNYSVEVEDGKCKVSKDFEVSSIFCEIPKGISPNNDQRNDSFDLRNLGVSKLEIFDRYGLKVYSKFDYNSEWDGTSDKGQQLPDGTYYYIVEFKSGKSKTGWVYLNREH